LEIYGIHYTLRIYFIIHYTLYYIGRIFDISFCDLQFCCVHAIILLSFAQRDLSKDQCVYIYSTLNILKK